MAELFYRAAADLQSSNSITVTNTSLAFWTYFAPEAGLSIAGSPYSGGSAAFNAALSGLQGWGDSFMRLVQFHGDPSGHLSEEFDRQTGYMVGAVDLTWSYASVLTAAFARAQLIGDSGYVATLANLGF
jgi:glucoamylase